MKGTLRLEEITVDLSIQCRVKMNQDAIDNYKESLERGEVLPDVVVFSDGETNWLSEGFHRFEAYKSAGKTIIGVELHEGGYDAAWEHALGANYANGLPRTNKDKEKAVKRAIEKWPTLSNVMIAEKCRVSEFMVRNHRPTSIQSKFTLGKDNKRRPSTMPPREKPEAQPEPQPAKHREPEPVTRVETFDPVETMLESIDDDIIHKWWQCQHCNNDVLWESSVCTHCGYDPSTEEEPPQPLDEIHEFLKSIEAFCDKYPDMIDTLSSFLNQRIESKRRELINA